jgi:hypothetical protein
MRKKRITAKTLPAYLFSIYERHRLDELTPANCKHRTIGETLNRLSKHSGLLTTRNLGESLEGRAINCVLCGRGRTGILLWSQMHGDESTATLALMDIFNFLTSRAAEEEWISQMLDAVMLYVVPMLNPDGAERVQRYTATEIDMNRDARALATPEARILRNVQRRYQPAFGFNLHDQELSAVGATRKVTAVGLLAPALDAERSVPPVRRRAMSVAAVVAGALDRFAHGHLAKYDDTHEARAFGDNMQQWGTSTVLIESGHWPRDREKKFIRKLNFVGILAALRAIADRSYRTGDLEVYHRLDSNTKSMYDIIIQNIILRHENNWSHRVDLGLTITPQAHRLVAHPNVTIKEIGDLSSCGALEIIRGNAQPLLSSAVAVEKSLPLAELLTLLHINTPHA